MDYKKLLRATLREDHEEWDPDKSLSSHSEFDSIRFEGLGQNILDQIENAIKHGNWHFGPDDHTPTEIFQYTDEPFGGQKVVIRFKTQNGQICVDYELTLKERVI
jgi:hypothetical protein